MLEYRSDGTTLTYRWANVVPGFAMPVKVTVAPDRYAVIRPTEAWHTATVSVGPGEFKVDQNYYVLTREAAPGGA